MRKVLIYFQDDRARHRQQKGWPPCGRPRTTPTIRKGQRDHLRQVRRGSRGPSRSYVVAKVQVRLAFSLTRPSPLLASSFSNYRARGYILYKVASFIRVLLLLHHSTSPILRSLLSRHQPGISAAIPMRFARYMFMRYSAPCTRNTRRSSRRKSRK